MVTKSKIPHSQAIALVAPGCSSVRHQLLPHLVLTTNGTDRIVRDKVLRQ